MKVLLGMLGELSSQVCGESSQSDGEADVSELSCSVGGASGPISKDDVKETDETWLFYFYRN